jgi:hypothetical protein
MMKRREFVKAVAVGLLLYLITSPLSTADGKNQKELPPAPVHSPAGPFVTSPTETVRPMSFGSVPAGRVAQALIEARREEPNAVLLATLSGTITVTNAPLRVPSRTCVIFAPGGAVVAGPHVGADCLVEIANAEFVSLSTQSGTVSLDGGGRVAIGVRVRGCGKVHLDRLAVTGCTEIGLAYTGRGGDRFADSGSVTRSSFLRCGRGGIAAREAAQFLCLGNTVAECGGTGLAIDSPQGLVAGNTVSGGDVGMRAGGAGLVVTRNVLTGRRVALVATDTANGCLFSENTFGPGERTVDLAGTACAFFGNTFPATTVGSDSVPTVLSPVESETKPTERARLRVTGKGHTFVANRNLPPAAVPVDDALWFDPPTAARNLEENVVAGLGSFDLAITGRGPKPTPLSQVQETLDEARQSHPQDVVVATLRGSFIADAGPTGLRLPPNTCIVLDGSISAATDDLDRNKSPHGGATQLVLMPSKGVASIAGGVLDGAGLPQHVVNAPGSAVVVLDSVTVRRSGFNAITTKERHSLSRPMFVRGCRVTDNANRGIWVHVCRSVHAIANICTANGADGIDFDAYGRNSTALFNTCTGNRRHGVFVEEPGTADNTIFANRLHGNRSHEICLYNSSKTKPLARNLLACNDCAGDPTRTAISVRALMHDNVLFNNVCRTGKLIGGLWSSRDTYVAQNITDVAPKTVTGIGPFFCTPGPKPPRKTDERR